mmetsp:Transcript_87033/g.127295  ORF Transcript_87033/g.127295 Transcript_87033/m.127295 type:complete len:107 (+) Transcript_87033:201-521(+)
MPSGSLPCPLWRLVNRLSFEAGNGIGEERDRQSLSHVDISYKYTKLHSTPTYSYIYVQTHTHMQTYTPIFSLVKGGAATSSSTRARIAEAPLLDSMVKGVEGFCSR